MAMTEYFNTDSYASVLQVVIGLVLYLCLRIISFGTVHTVVILLMKQISFMSDQLPVGAKIDCTFFFSQVFIYSLRGLTFLCGHDR